MKSFCGTKIILAAFLASACPISAMAQSISEVQGEGYVSPFVGQVVTVSGTLTLWAGKGFFLQSQEGDANPNTSEGIYVFVSDEAESLRTELEPGMVVTVTGEVAEFKPFSELPIPKWRVSISPGTTDMSASREESWKDYQPITQIAKVTDVNKVGDGSLPPPLLLNPPGSIGVQTFADVAGGPFDPTQYPRDYFESLEGMRVLIKDARTAGSKRSSWTTFPVVSADHLSDDELTFTGLPFHASEHIFPEIVTVKSAFRQPRFDVSPGTSLGDLVGILTYSNGRYIVQLETTIVRAEVEQSEQDAVPAASDDQLTLATYNLKNLDPKVEEHERPSNLTEEQFRGFRATDDIGDGRFREIATQIVNHLSSPDIIALQEVQDKDGTEVTLEADARETLRVLLDAIEGAGGPKYDAVAVPPPVVHGDGGQPGGNIQNAFLVRSDRDIEVIEHNRLFDDADAYPEFQRGRKPLRMRVSYDGTTFEIINVHLKSKLGDQGLYTNHENPMPQSENQRLAQVASILDFLASSVEHSKTPIVVLGDFNDYASSRSVQEFVNAPQQFQIAEDHRGIGHTFSHEFGGIRSAIDFILVSKSKKLQTELKHYVQGNVDNLSSPSDHNPVWMSLSKED